MKAFCEECRDYMDYQIIEVEREKDIKGKFIKFKEQVAHCVECGNEIFVSDLRDKNLAAMDNAFRIVEELITVPEIMTLLKKYNIGKRPMSLLLGWGETTLTRFVNGDIPSKMYSDQLKRLYESPKSYLDLLRCNKDKVSEIAFKKSFDATNQLMEKVDTCFTEAKIESVCNYMIAQSIEITPLALQKLLYFTQAFHKVFFGEFMFIEDCEAWVHGPVYPEVYYKYKDHGYNPIDDNQKQFECFDLSSSEIEVIDAVINYFGCYSGKILEKMTHVELPWKESRKGLADKEASCRIIKKDIIEKYFNNVSLKYKMLNVADIKDYSEDLFEKIRV